MYYNKRLTQEHLTLDVLECLSVFKYFIYMYVYVQYHGYCSHGNRKLTMVLLLQIIIYKESIKIIFFVVIT